MNPDSQLTRYPTRRALLRTAAVAAVTVPALAGCVTSGKDSSGEPAEGAEKTTDNPLGVKADAPLEVVVFKGGYGDDYAIKAEAAYTARYPQAKIDHKGLQKVGEAMQPRFVGGNPPDVVDNTGAGRLDIGTLVSAGQVSDLADLLDAPSLDQPGKKVRDTLLPGVIDDGTFAGKTVALNFTYTVWGLWYSKSLFAERGWTFPKTWAEMTALNAEIKKAGVAPWTYQGKYPEYINDPLLTMAAKAGGLDLVKAVDNLQPGAWKQEGLVQAATAFAELAGQGYLMSGSEALSHTEAQAAWCQKKAAFIPCGSWLEAEQKGVAPAGFDMVMGTVPALSSSDRLPVTAVQAASSESYVVPAKAKNVAGGKEYLRHLFSKESATAFAQANSTLPAVEGATDGLTLSSGLGSVRDAVTAAGTDTFSYKFRTWYGPLAKAVDDATGELVNKRISPADWSTRIQKAADALAKDTTVTKYTR
ncbi:carbohydrate ABC transporter, N-acetylglucosamine/diacetylchitobiose-binding protein [Paractinoplanes abujensis]|uniref:N-acetylglucosamine transport system substrate-binding protein n=1 Tax=Paractinoplanes abujensis TaxID=882441 RepID=A0A7W7G2G4_9ACTN|nr:N-acetylglucosamine/diacetylchitobiose ABC transporter substrate-binding protein [Actinoplanes abujensis]MBB4691646.1 N-acetylglucosamine transport system substrate-binding protein [Actinoplanes abujensis]GID16935.1 carbohydrate ABC transporter, N-acetylglucosamine/diacetylchitobiose-binding protein [Actinoplanes abujensis]